MRHLTVSCAAVKQLLRESDHSVEAAVAKYFHQSAPDQIEAPPSPFTALRALVGTEVSDWRIRALLQQSGNSVEAALDLHLGEHSADNEAEGQSRPERGVASTRSVMSTLN